MCGGTNFFVKHYVFVEWFGLAKPSLVFFNLLHLWAIWKPFHKFTESLMCYLMEMVHFFAILFDQWLESSGKKRERESEKWIHWCDSRATTEMVIIYQRDGVDARKKRDKSVQNGRRRKKFIRHDMTWITTWKHNFPATLFSARLKRSCMMITLFVIRSKCRTHSSYTFHIHTTRI